MLDASLALSAFIASGVLDTVTTMMCGTAYGYSYESSTLVRDVVGSAGITGLFALKAVATLICLALLYVIASHPLLRYPVRGLMVGVTIVGLFAGISNMDALWSGSSIFIFGIAANYIAYVLLVLSLVCGILFAAWKRDQIKAELAQPNIPLR